MLRGDAEQARGFERMRRQDGGLAALATLLQHVFKCRCVGDRIQCVGIDDQPLRLVKQSRQDLAHDVTTATAADHRCRTERGVIETVEITAPHQFRAQQIDQGSVAIERHDPYPPGACGMGGPGAQHRSAAHAGSTADDDDVAEAALVAGMAPPGALGALQPAQPGVGLQDRCVAAELVEPDVAGVVAARTGEQAGLERQQRKGVAGTNGGVAEWLSGVAIDSGRQVDRQHAAGQPIQLLDQIGDRACGCTVAAKPEQGVDGQIVAGQRDRTGTRRLDLQAGPSCTRQAGRRIGGQPPRISRQRQRDSPALGLQMASGFDAVAAVVARPGGNPYPIGKGCNGGGQACHRQACPNHQPRFGSIGAHGSERRRLDLARVGRAEDRMPVPRRKNALHAHD